MSVFQNLGDCLRLPNRKDDIAFVDLGHEGRPVSFTAGQLDFEINAVARGLVGMGFGPGDRIALISANRVEFVIAYCAIMRMGAVAVPINYKLSDDTVAHILKDSDCQLIMADNERANLFGKYLQLINFDSAASNGFAHIKAPGDFATYQPTHNDLAEILYTSGSTGVPKGVPLNHAGQCWAIAKFLQPLDADEAQAVTPIIAPMYHMNALFFTCIALSNRMKIISIPKFDATNYLNIVAEYKCDYLTGVPAFVTMAARAKDKPLPEALKHVKRLHIGSSPITKPIVDDAKALFPNAVLTNSYGTTEAGPAVFGAHPNGLSRPVQSVGYPLPDIEWRFLEGTTTEGTLQLRTPALTKGYLNRPDQTARKFQEGWYDTGDVMRRDEDGFFYYMRRSDDMFVCGGENIYPNEVEKILDSHPGVVQSVVVPAPDEVKGSVPVAFVVRRSGDFQMNSGTLKRYVLKNGPAYLHPRRIVFVSTLPYGGTGKIDRRKLARDAASITAVEYEKNHIHASTAKL